MFKKIPLLLLPYVYGTTTGTCTAGAGEVEIAAAGEGYTYSEVEVILCDGTTATFDKASDPNVLSYTLGDCYPSGDTSATRVAKLRYYTTDEGGNLIFGEHNVDINCGEMATHYEATYDFDNVQLKEEEITVGDDSAAYSFSVIEFTNENYTELTDPDVVLTRHAGDMVYLAIGQFHNSSSGMTDMVALGDTWAPTKCTMNFGEGDTKDPYVFFDITDSALNNHPGLNFGMSYDGAREVWVMFFKLFLLTDSAESASMTCDVTICSSDIVDGEDNLCEEVQIVYGGTISIGGATGVIFVG